MGKRKRRRKRSGHGCWCCGRRRPNEKFSGRGHRRHLCKDCAKLGKDELDYRQGLRDVGRLECQLMSAGRARRRQAADALRRTASSDARPRIREYAREALVDDQARRKGYRNLRPGDQLAFAFMTEAGAEGESWDELDDGAWDEPADRAWDAAAWDELDLPF